MIKPPSQTSIARLAKLGAAVFLGGALLAGAFNIQASPDGGVGVSPAMSEHRFRLYTGETLVLTGNSAALVAQIERAGVRETLGSLGDRVGYCVTALPEGQVLVFGGRSSTGLLATTSYIYDAKGGQLEVLSQNVRARDLHTGTLLTDGRILLVGGRDERGMPVATLDALNAKNGQGIDLDVQLIMPRYGHTARLLASGSVLIEGGYDQNGRPVEVAELFDVSTGRVLAYNDELRWLHETQYQDRFEVAEMLPPHESRDVDLEEFVAIRFTRSADAATINADTVLLLGPTGAVASSMVSAGDGLLLFIVPEANLMPGARYTLFTKGIHAVDGATFAFYGGSFTTKTLTASPPSPVASPSVIGSPDASNPALVHPLAHLQWELPIRSKAGDDDGWFPGQENLNGGRWQDNRPLPNRNYPELPTANQGVTAISGRVIKLNGQAFAGAVVKLGSESAETDSSGAFLLSNVKPGYGVLEVDGDANSIGNGANKFGFYQIRVEAIEGKTTPLGFPIWLTKLDSQGNTKISSPTTQDTVVTTPAIPGLEIRIPAGTVIKDKKGNVVTEINLTAIPVNRPPFPLPDLNVPVFFTVQPGGAWLQGVNAGPALGAQIVYPNYEKKLPDSRVSFFNYDPRDKDWYVYGEGQISKDGIRAVPDAGTVIYEFTGAMFNSNPPAPPPNAPPPNGPGGPEGPGSGGTGGPDGGPPSPLGPGSPPEGPLGPGGDGGSGGTGTGDGGDDGRGLGHTPDSDDAGDPVSASTGYFSRTEVDLYLKDVVPISLKRTYRSQDNGQRTFGIGWVTGYDTFLYSQAQAGFQEVDVILPEGGRAHFVRISAGTSYTDAVFESVAPGVWYKARIHRNNTRAGWDLLFRDGSRWFFPQYQPLKEMVDSKGNTTTITRRDNNGNSGPITRISSPNGRYIDLTLDTTGRVTQARDNSGRTVTYTYDASGRLATATKPLNGSYTYTYDIAHRLLTVTNPLNTTLITNEYDTNGRIFRQTLPDTTTFQFAYTVSAGKVTQTEVTDQRGKVRKVEFGSTGHITKSTAAFGTSQAEAVTFSLNTNGQMLTKTDALGRVTSYSYDTFGNVIGITQLYGTVDARTTSFTYSPDGARFLTSTDPLNHTTTFSFDSKGYLIGVTDPLNHTIAYTRNAQGRVLTRTDALNHVWTYGYSGNDLVSITDPLSRQTRFATDGSGRITSITDPNGSTTQIEWSDRDRITKVTNPVGTFVESTYDDEGKRLSIKDENGHTRSWTYNQNVGHVATMVDALSQSETYAYGPNGRVSQHVDRKGQLTGMTYDHLNRISQRGYGATTSNPTAYTSTIDYTYDAGNRVTQIVDSVGGTIGRSYNGFDQLTQETTSEGTIGYTYDNAGRRATMTVSGQSTVTYTWDDANRLTQLTKGTSSIFFGYDAADRRTSMTLSNGIVATYGYNNANELTSITYVKGGTTVGDIHYGYDLAGRRVSASGSLATVNLPTAVASGTYNANNSQTAWAGASLTYDANGNLTTYDGATYTWNARNELSGISGSLSASLSYDGTARRRGKTINGAQTRFLYDGPGFVQELDGNGVTGNLISGGDELLLRQDGGGSRHALRDAAGSVLALTDDSGSVVTQYSYEPYGLAVRTGSATSNSQTFTGREDDGTNLLYYRARYYHPGLARFISEDPSGPADGPNLYMYVRGNPIQWIDPTGRVIEVPYAGAAADAAFGEFAHVVHGMGTRAFGFGIAFGLGVAIGNGFNAAYNNDQRSVGSNIYDWWNDSKGTPHWERPNPNPWKR